MYIYIYTYSVTVVVVLSLEEQIRTGTAAAGAGRESSGRGKRASRNLTEVCMYTFSLSSLYFMVFYSRRDGSFASSVPFPFLLPHPNRVLG